jgi:predicted phage baseplate assembly protein
MTRPPEEQKLDPCGCCESKVSLPEKHYNRPGQPALAYRIGTHSSFLRRMLASLPKEAIAAGPKRGARPLAALTTRSTDDPAIAFLDAWATVADVLTFYQERIANEGYLRTATERRSVLELARAIGYELNPGVAASTFLAFTVEEAPGAPRTVKIPQRTQVQSIPAPGKLPQTFETGEEIEARVEWNSLKPGLSWPQDLAVYEDSLYVLDTHHTFLADTSTAEPILIADLFLVGTDITFKEGLTEVLGIKVDQVYIKGATHNLRAGDFLLLAGKNQSTGKIRTITRSIRDVEPESKADRTRVDFAEKPQEPLKLPSFRIPSPKLATAVPKSVSFNADNVRRMVSTRSWRERDLAAFLNVNRWNGRELDEHMATVSEPVAPPADQGVFAFGQRVGFFGHNAPLHATLPKPDNTRGTDPYSEGWDGASERTIWQDSQGEDYTEKNGSHVHFERCVPEVLGESWVIFEAADGTLRPYRVSAVSEASLADYGISGKATGLKLTNADGTELLDKAVDFKVRKTTAYVQSKHLEVADLPIDDPLAETEETDEGKEIKTGVTRVMLDRRVGGLQVEQPLVLSGERADVPGVVQNEVAILQDIVIHEGRHTILYFRDRLQHPYLLNTVTLNANVAPVTHGEMVKEVLGSGDGSKTNQRFKLKKPPLTYVSARKGTGAISTLELRVNGILWDEATSLYGLDSRSENFILRIENDGTTWVILGDGKNGARLPTGLENVAADYRYGIGSDGEVDAGSLTLLKTRPFGIREVTNPLRADGADAPENLDEARGNAPLTVLTFDRIVSVKDFEDFARGYKGIGKARAARLWDGESQVVHITIASVGGQPIDVRLEPYRNLVKTMEGVCNPVQTFCVDDYDPLLFRVDATIRTDQRYVTEEVRVKVEAALYNMFAFERRTLGQPVTAAEITSMIQKVPGVVAVDLNKLYLVTDPHGSEQVMPAPVLPATEARWDPDTNRIQPAQLLLLDPASVILTAIEETL